MSKQLLAATCCILICLTCAATKEEPQLVEFINTVEELVLSVTDRALLVTRNVYLHLDKAMPPQLQNITGQMMASYVAKVDRALAEHANYTTKRQLFRQFKNNNFRLDQLRAKLYPQQPEFQFQLISDEFYNEGRNTTEFDNLYLEFMQKFQRASQHLWTTMTEKTVEEQEDLLEILDEISNEQQLREKDKLYDEFIEMYLFKSPPNLDSNTELY